MTAYAWNWNDWYSGWGWILWFGMIFLLFSTTGSWGYAYQTHRRYRRSAEIEDAFAILAARYAKGEITRADFKAMQNEISDALKNHPARGAAAPMRTDAGVLAT